MVRKATQKKEKELNIQQTYTNALKATMDNTPIPKYYEVNLKDEQNATGKHIIYIQGKMIEFNDGKAVVSEKTADILQEMNMI